MHQLFTSLYHAVTTGSGKDPYATTEALVEGLKKMETKSVVWVMEKTEPSVRYLIRQAALPENLTRDVLHDALMILVKKIRDNIFDPNESAPTTYLIAVARNLISNHKRQHRNIKTVALEQVSEIPDSYTQSYLEGRERREQLETLLTTLGDPCAKLIRLKYLDGYRDEEILDQKLTHYTTSMALRSKRSKCFQQLVALAGATNSDNKTITSSMDHSQALKIEKP